MAATSLWTALEQQLVPTLAAYRSRIMDVPVSVKADRTLLTDADVAVQDLIVKAIRSHEPGAVIIAEEDERTAVRDEVASCTGRVWVVDPIDGTSQFVRADKVEFCSVVCLLEDWRPVEAFVLAPELGPGRTAVVITASTADGSLSLDGRPAQKPQSVFSGSWLSVTRSADTPPRPVEAAAIEQGHRIKTRTTSQTLDLVRTAVDISALTEPSLPSFSLFWRRGQKVWDGVAGLCLAAAAGLEICDEHREPLATGPGFLSRPTPVFASTVVGQPQTVRWFLDTVHR